MSGARRLLLRARTLARLALVTEWRMYCGAVRLLTRRAQVPDGAGSVAYSGTVALAMWAFTAVSAVELVALHLIIPWEGVRLAADALGIWGVLWCLGMTGCHYVYPHLVTDAGLVVRNAERSAAAVVPWDLVVGVGVRERSHESGRRVQLGDDPARAELIVPVGKVTTLHVDLRTPLDVVVGGARQGVTRVVLAADEPRVLAALVRERAGLSSPRPGRRP
ncbi:hypothetical protein [Nocardioides sp. AX2bis]|uniref:hypothetical protein n=1 Tax=Nocardioides sp. AX2bis TaxID=2653157 RepID=UPI0012F31F95|nr:hypothetical protein [Nocardioides sp. AX2bis]VXB65005.1 conserved hypothetical protein [Nocardioides sp. AX2bis]